MTYFRNFRPFIDDASETKAYEVVDFIEKLTPPILVGSEERWRLHTMVWWKVAEDEHHLIEVRHGEGEGGSAAWRVVASCTTFEAAMAAGALLSGTAWADLRLAVGRRDGWAPNWDGPR